jgi:hypothetical protein
MKIIATALLALLLVTGIQAVVVAQPAGAPQRTDVTPAPPGPGGPGSDAQRVAPRSDDRDRQDNPAALPRTVERPHILGMSVSTAIFVAALILFVIVLGAASMSRDDDRPYKRTDIDPRL